MKEYFEKLTDKQLLDLVEGYHFTSSIPLDHPIRIAAHDLFGKEDMDAFIKLAIPLMKEITRRYEQLLFQNKM